ncbi:MAG TPA: glycosyltransferase [Acidisarcina sp.]
MPSFPRVAYFPDSFHEVNGVAHTSRHFEAFARRRGLPFLMVRAGDRADPFIVESALASLELKRGFLSFALDKDLRFDPGFVRHIPLILRTVRDFRPDIIHITGPSELGMIGAWLAHKLKVPLVASWHTNVHEYLARRSRWLLSVLPPGNAVDGGKHIEDLTLKAAARFYRLARILFAPNVELTELLSRATGRPCFLMPRGVDTLLFSPEQRDRPTEDKTFVLGFVGRLAVEKNVALLADIHRQLVTKEITDFSFNVIGQGAEESWLRENIPGIKLPGVLRGPDLSRAYANMDVFVFPSHTDTFGNVVLEALASGVPAVVTPDGGPRYIVCDGETGYVASDEEFADAVAGILLDPPLHTQMRLNARTHALSASWDAVFEGVYTAYETVSLPRGAQPTATR